MEPAPGDDGAPALRQLDAQLGQLHQDWDPAPAPAPAPPAPQSVSQFGWCGSALAGGLGADKTRRGKWTAPECDYAAIVIEHFADGRLPGLSGGESLRATLAELLGCAPMRITKKLSSTRAHGKQCFKNAP